MTQYHPTSRPYGYPSVADPRFMTVVIQEVEGLYVAHGITRLGQAFRLAQHEDWARCKNKAWWAAYNKAKQFRRRKHGTEQGTSSSLG